MEHEVRASHGGSSSRRLSAPGDQVESGRLLVVIEEEASLDCKHEETDPGTVRGEPMDFVESDEQQMLRDAVASIAVRYGHEYYVERSERPRRPTSFGTSFASAGYLGVNVPAQYGGGGQGSPSWRS